MDSQIWRVRTEKIGSLEPFKSERDMESFLMINPAIVGCWNPSSNLALPSLIRQQVFIKSDKDIGRIDLIGLAVLDEGYELRIFELKAVDILVEAVEQLNSYLEVWKKESITKTEIKQWILNLGLKDIEDQNIDEIVSNPVGILIGPKFQPEAISKAIGLNIQGIRLARFKAERESEYFVIVEDQVGKIVENVKRQWTWNDLIQDGLVEGSDSFKISYEGESLFARPDPLYLDNYTKRILFDHESRAKIIAKEKEIREKAIHEYDLKWLDKAFSFLKKEESVYISNATGLFYFAFGGPNASYWVPTSWWIHEKSGKDIEELKNDLFNKHD